MDNLQKIYQLEATGKFSEAYQAWQELFEFNKGDFEVFKRYLFFNWYMLTLVHGWSEKEEKLYQEKLVELADYGLEEFSEHKDLLITLGEMCTGFFFLFGRDDTFGQTLLRKALELFPDDPIVRYMNLEGPTDKIERKAQFLKKQIAPILNEKYPSNGLYDKYFRDTFS